MNSNSIHAPRLILGTMTFGDQTSKAEARAMIEYSLECGISSFDTANHYNGGRSEEVLGEIVQPFRDQVSIATKVFNWMGEGEDYSGLSKSAINEALDNSLRRLRTDRVEIYYLHQPDWGVDLEETLGAMQELVNEGRIATIGVSNYAAWQIAEISRICRENGWDNVRISQQQYNLLSRRLEEEYTSYSLYAGLTDIVYNPLAGGMLTGKHAFSQPPSKDSRFAKQNYVDRYWNVPQFNAVTELEEIAQDAGLSLLEMSFRWLWSQPIVDSVLLGASKVEHLKENIAAASRREPLDSAILDRCDDVWKTLLRGPAPSYNR